MRVRIPGTYPLARVEVGVRFLLVSFLGFFSFEFLFPSFVPCFRVPLSFLNFCFAKTQLTLTQTQVVGTKRVGVEEDRWRRWVLGVQQVVWRGVSASFFRFVSF